MKSQTLPQFWRMFRRLPRRIQRRASQAYQLWAQNPNAPGLRFKRVATNRQVYSIRIGDQYRALGLLQDDTVTWFWIGSHADYDRLLKEL